MAASQDLEFGIIKIENSPSPQPAIMALEQVSGSNPVPIPIDPKDPESFLRRCSGFNKKTKLRCNSVIGQKSQQNCHPTFLPTCRSHRDQHSYAGWCQYQAPTGERCSRLFRWTPPYFELCEEHQGHPDTPCHFLKLPLELRQEVFSYLLPYKPIGSTTAALHYGRDDIPKQLNNHNCFSTHVPLQARRRHTHRHLTPPIGRPGTIFPMPVLDIFLVSRQFYQEAKDTLFSSSAFTIDVRKDGTFMCGRRLLEPRRADGSSHFLPDQSDETKQRFLKYFDWSAVKHYAVDILVENWADQMQAMYPNHSTWDEEVELYDIRDYISVVVSGILANSRNLCKLQVRLCLAEFDWPHGKIMENTKLILGPFERLRNVRQPQLLGVYMGRPNHNSMLTVLRPPKSSGSMAPICSVPSVPTHTPLILPGFPDFDAYSSDWARWISSSSSSSVTSKPPIRSMFTEFKNFYSKLSYIVPDVSRRGGRQAFLHRARVAREQEDVESFREIRNELINYWFLYLEKEEQKKKDMTTRMNRMLDTDVYPSHEWTTTPPKAAPPAHSALQSPVLLNPAAMAKEGIPMTGNPPNLTHIRHSVLDPHGQSLSPQVKAQNKAQQQRLMQAAIERQAQIKALNTPHQDTMSSQFDLGMQIDTPDFGLSKDVFEPMIQVTAIEDPFSMLEVGTNPNSQVDTVDVGCFAHVGLSSDWYRNDGEPGPSNKRRRVDSGYSEVTTVGGLGSTMQEETVKQSTSYVGKGKGKVGVPEVICLD